MEGEVVRGQHSDSQARAQRSIQEAADDRLVLQRHKSMNAFNVRQNGSDRDSTKQIRIRY